jgi:hypothetical protein
LLELYKDDKMFKKFIVHHLKEKLVKTTNIHIRDLMTALIETLDMPEYRGEIIRYALNSENFYAFPIQYLISLMSMIIKITPHIG